MICRFKVFTYKIKDCCWHIDLPIRGRGTQYDIQVNWGQELEQEDQVGMRRIHMERQQELSIRGVVWKPSVVNHC